MWVIVLFLILFACVHYLWWIPYSQRKISEIADDLFEINVLTGQSERSVKEATTSGLELDSPHAILEFKSKIEQSKNSNNIS